jgi:hypothetical protein
MKHSPYSIGKLAAPMETQIIPPRVPATATRTVPGVDNRFHALTLFDVDRPRPDGGGTYSILGLLLGGDWTRVAERQLWAWS